MRRKSGKTNPIFKSSHLKVFLKKLFFNISQNSQQSSCVAAFLINIFKSDACKVIEKDTATVLFFCEFCKSFNANKAGLFEGSFFWPSFIYIYIFLIGIHSMQG